MHVLIVGAGYSGLAVARELAGHAAGLTGTTRSPNRFGELRAAGLEPLLFDGETVTTDLGRAIERATHLVISAAPDEAGDPTLRAAGDLIRRAPALCWIGYLSTVGVYGDRGGGWVDETAPPVPAAGSPGEKSLLR